MFAARHAAQARPCVSRQLGSMVGELPTLLHIQFVVSASINYYNRHYGHITISSSVYK